MAVVTRGVWYESRQKSKDENKLWLNIDQVDVSNGQLVQNDKNAFYMLGQV